MKSWQLSWGRNAITLSAPLYYYIGDKQGVVFMLFACNCQGQLAHCEGQLAHCQGQLAHCQGQLAHCQGQLAHCQGQLAHNCVVLGR